MPPGHELLFHIARVTRDAHGFKPSVFREVLDGKAWSMFYGDDLRLRRAGRELIHHKAAAREPLGVKKSDLKRLRA